MKKLISLLLVMMLSIAIAVPAFAAVTAQDIKDSVSKAQGKGLITASQASEINGVVDALADPSQIDLDGLKNVVKNNEAAIKNGTLGFKGLSEQVNACFGSTGITVSFSNVSSNGTKMTADVSFSVPAAATTNNTAIAKTVNVSNGGTPEPFYGSETPAANAANPIKATGMDMSFGGVAVLGFAFVSVLGFAVVATRKLASAE